MSLQKAHKHADQTLDLQFVIDVLEGLPAIPHDRHEAEKLIHVGGEDADTGHKILVELTHYEGNRPNLTITYTINRDKDPSMASLLGSVSARIDEKTVYLDGIQFENGRVVFNTISFFGDFLHDHKGAAEAVLRRIGDAIRGNKLTPEDACFHTVFHFGPPEQDNAGPF